MFHIPRVNVVESDAGYSVEILGRTGMEYREANKAMFVTSEILMTDVPTIAIWKDEIRAWVAPHEKERIDELKRDEIVANICAALKWRNIKIEVHSEVTGWVKG